MIPAILSSSIKIRAILMLCSESGNNVMYVSKYMLVILSYLT